MVSLQLRYFSQSKMWTLRVEYASLASVGGCLLKIFTWEFCLYTCMLFNWSYVLGIWDLSFIVNLCISHWPITSISVQVRREIYMHHKRRVVSKSWLCPCVRTPLQRSTSCRYLLMQFRNTPVTEKQLYNISVFLYFHVKIEKGWMTEKRKLYKHIQLW